MKLLNISGSPHVHSDESTQKIMWRVNLALVPTLLIAIAYFGINALLVSLVSVAVCVLCQWLIEKFILKVPTAITDGSAVVTGLLLSFNVPATPSMIWIVAIGAIVAIGIGKMTFGGLGKNPFNPALVGRVFMLISFPVQMTTWPRPSSRMFANFGCADVTTGATPLGILKEGGMEAFPEAWQLFLGHIGGSLGEVSALAILIGAIYLLVTRTITWHIPVSFLGTAFLFSWILAACDPSWNTTGMCSAEFALNQLLMGGIILGACFMATDMVTSPMSHVGQLVFGFGCGLLTIIIRRWGAYPEGVSFAILIMNGVTPLLNRWFKPQRFAA